MLTAKSLFVASLALPTLAYWKDYNIAIPNGNNIEGGIEYRTNSKDTWFTLESDAAGFSLGGSYDPSKLGYRLKSEGDSSSIIYSYDSSVEPLLVETNEGDRGIFWVHTISQDYPTSGAESAVTKREVWDDGDFKYLPFQNRVLEVINSGCNYGMALTLEVWDAQGNYQVFNGTDDIQYAIPDDAFPLNATATATQFATSADLYITGEEPILYALGDGTVPTIKTGYVLQVQVCPD
ncbi:hypothetical protein BDZ89DRAFT_1156959 [Hymenopellis radicata]|nr:hypothetical protein BDZ89DRAFT_1156959 [Hymenopellis radicata]